MPPPPPARPKSPHLEPPPPNRPPPRRPSLNPPSNAPPSHPLGAFGPLLLGRESRTKARRRPPRGVHCHSIPNSNPPRVTKATSTTPKWQKLNSMSARPA